MSFGLSISRNLTIIDGTFVEMPLTLRKKTLRSEISKMSTGYFLPKHPSLKKAEYPEVYDLAQSASNPYALPGPPADSGALFFAVKFDVMKKRPTVFQTGDGQVGSITVGVV